MSGPSWFAGVLAALMLAVAAVAAARLCWRLPGRRAETDADALHVLMGVAMAGMFEPGIGSVPAVAWQAVFAAGAAWFTWQAIRRRGTVTAARQSHPGAHVVECCAMLYVLWPTATGGTGMSGMAANAGAISGNPAIALVLAVGMLGYLVWAVDQLLDRGRRAAARAEHGAVLASDAAADRSGDPPLAQPAGPRGGYPAGPVPAPRLAACQKITMGLAMCYMLVTML
jgi:Domain of unknown function (DUF5134)